VERKENQTLNFAMISAVSGGLAALDRLDAITTNLANVSTVGFKSLLHTQVADRTGKTSTVGQAPRTPIVRSRIVGDFSQGPVETTGNPLHVALEGRGFFVVDTPQGERLTRRGTFALDDEGYLVTAEGHRVQGDGGDLQLGSAPREGKAIQIGTDGTVRVGDSQIGRIRVVDGGDPALLGREPGGLYRPAGKDLGTLEKQAYTIRQGATERSNVSAVQNLVAMVEAMRGFEAYMNALDRVDNINERSIRDVGRV